MASSAEQKPSITLPLLALLLFLLFLRLPIQIVVDFIKDSKSSSILVLVDGIGLARIILLDGEYLVAFSIGRRLIVERGASSTLWITRRIGCWFLSPISTARGLRFGSLLFLVNLLQL